MRLQTTALLVAGIQQPSECLPNEEPGGSNVEGEQPLQGLPCAPEVPLPPVWQDFFGCLARASAPQYVTEVACSSDELARCEGEPMAPHTIFKVHLSPEALVLRHRLGLPEIRRIYRALQVYSTGFHQTLMEAAAHAVDRSNLLVAVWRGFAMLWDGALQTIFASETAKLSREKQAATMSAEAALALLREAEMGRAAATEEGAGLKARMEEMVVEMLSVKADASVLAQSVSAAHVEAKKLRREATVVAKELEAKKAEVYALQGRLQELGGPQLELSAKADAMRRMLEEKQEMLGASAMREMVLAEERDAAQNLARAERVKRERAQTRTAQLQAELDDISLKLRTLQAEHVAALAGKANQQHLEDRLALLTAADSKVETWRARAEAAEAKAAALEAQLTAEKARNDELIDSTWPLAAKVKALEAQLTAMGVPKAG